MTFNRDNFIALNGSRLFGAGQVCDIVCKEVKAERERMLDAVKHMIEYNDDLFMYMGTQILPRKVVAYKFLLSDEGIKSLRGEP